MTRASLLGLLALTACGASTETLGVDTRADAPDIAVGFDTRAEVRHDTSTPDAPDLGDGSLDALPPGCGDNACANGETCATCPADCGPCAPGCGNGACTGFETCSTCPMDCGACPTDVDDATAPDAVDAGPDDAPADTAGDTGPGCGDGDCAADEHCFTCPADCGACSECGDGACGMDEGCTACPLDCTDCEISDGCASSEAAGCGGCACEVCVCVDDPYCCTVMWDASCVDQCEGSCGGCDPLESCGDDECDAPETCTLCPEDCGSCHNPGCLLHPSSGCNGCLCEEFVCAADPVCCLGAWDELCVQACADGGFCASDGCHTTLIPGCSGCPCQQAVCADDPVCCQDGWDAYCVDACIDLGACD